MRGTTDNVANNLRDFCFCAFYILGIPDLKILAVTNEQHGRPRRVTQPSTLVHAPGTQK
jgi:hypothetical protein